MRRAFVIAVCLLVSVPALARLSETLKQCNLRYGRPAPVKVRRGLHCRLYKTRAYEIIATFSAGRAVELYYCKADGLTGRDIRSVLGVNSKGRKWTKVDQLAEWREKNKGNEADEKLQVELAEEISSYYRWRRSDGKAEAAYDRIAEVLIVYDTNHMANQRDKK